MRFSDKQLLSIQESTAAYNFWVGAISAGKTYASIYRLTEINRTLPPGDGMIVGVSRSSIQRNVFPLLYEHFLGESMPSSKATDDRMYGRKIWFVGAHDESAVRSIKGATLAWAYVDEISEIPLPFMKMLEGRLRVPGAMLLGTTNPEGPSHWLKKEYIDRAQELGYKYWNFTLDDNPGLDETYKARIKASYQGMWYQRYVLGQWAAAHGLIYDSFCDVNVYENRLASPKFYVVGLDYGTVNPTAAVLMGVSPKQWPQIRIEAEYYYDPKTKSRSKTDAELADDIKEFCSLYPVRVIYVDPSAASLKMALQQLNMPVADARNDVLLGIKHTNKFISQKNLVVHKSCVNLLEHIQSYAWDPKAADKGEDKPLKVNDHILDALRYAIASTFPTGSLNDLAEDLTIDQIKRQIYGQDERLDLGGGSQWGYR